MEPQGVVTTFHLQAYPQTEVWVRFASCSSSAPSNTYQGGSILITGYPDDVVVATQNFYENVTDPKASLLTTFNNEIGIVSLGYFNCPCMQLTRSVAYH